MSKNTKILLSVVLGVLIVFAFTTTQILATSQTSIVKDTDSDFEEGTLTTTETVGSGTSAYVQIAGGAADWADANWSYRRPITVTSTYGSTLTEYQVKVSLTTGNFDYTNVQSDCDDIRFGDTGGSFINHFQISCDTSGTSEFWVQVPTLSNGSNTIYVYYGNGAATSGSDEAATFTYSTEKTVGYILHDTVDNLTVKSLENGNSITHNGSTLSLDEDATDSFSSIDADGAISATKLFGAFDPSDNTDAYVPVSFAGTEIIGTSRDSGSGGEEFFLLSPWGTANVTIYADGTSCYTNASLGSTVAWTGSSCNAGDGITYRISSDIPILAFMDEGGTDPYPLHPSDTGPWYGVEGTRRTFSANASGATVTYIESDDSSTSNVGISADRDSTVSTGGRYGDGLAYKVSSDNPITANQWADGDGGDAAIFLPYDDLGTKFGAANTSEYFSIASPSPAFCTVYDNSGSSVATGTATSTNSQVYKLDFGTGNSNTYVSTGWKVECDAPVYLHWQKAADSEANAWSYAQMRQYVYPTPTVGNPGAETGSLPSSGTYVSPTDSNVIDFVWNGGWGDGSGSSTAFSATVANVGGNSNIEFEMRVASTVGGLSGASYVSIGTANSGTSFTATKDDLDTAGLSTGTNRYAQVRATLNSTDGLTNPQLDTFTIFYLEDDTGPTANASSVDISGISDGDWTSNEPTITWTAGADADGGLLGYCIALDEADPGNSSSLDPELAGGALTGIDDGVTSNFCPFIATGTSLDLSGLSGLSLTSGKQYYISIKAVDVSGNIWAGASGTYQDLFSFRYDATAPTNPGFISLPGDFVSSKNVTITWPTSGGTEASDAHSGVAGLQYKIGSSGTWYGDSHLGTEDITDLLTNDGAYTTDVTYDYPDLDEGNNFIYFRTWDNAGNISSSTISGVLKLNTTAPSAPQNLTVTPSDSTTNSYAFDWDAPSTYTGQVSNITYCYTVNAVPTSTNCTYTAAGTTELSASSFATQPGTNNMYVVARDEANNINYATYTSTTFTYSGSAPGIPTNVDVADISIKATSNWKLALSWEAPEDIGAGVNEYEVFRSTTASSCSSSIGSFTSIGTTGGTSYTDTGLDQETYNYCVKACDNANNCSAVSTTVSAYPDGKFTDAATLTSEPVVSNITTQKATVKWSTDRTSDSKVQYGTSSDDYLDEEPSNSNQVTDHTINLDNLSPGTNYYIRAKWTDEDGNTGISDEVNFETDPAPTVKDVKAKTVGINSATLEFTTSGSTKAKIYYGESTSFGGLAEIATSSSETTYNVTLDGLTDGTKYFFKINTIDAEDDEYEGTILDFTTLPRPRISNVRIQQVRGTAQPTVLVTWDSNTEISSIATYYPDGNPSAARDEVNVALVSGEHRMIIRSLLPQTRYVLQVSGRDIAGNEAISDTQSFTTATDTRPPLIQNLKVESNIVPSSNDQQKAQLLITWDTDEPATSQVEFGEGTGASYSQRTQEDSNLTVNHLVIVSNLSPSKVYHLRALTTDDAGNTTESVDVVTITPKATDNALDLVITNLREAFGFIGEF